MRLQQWLGAACILSTLLGVSGCKALWGAEEKVKPTSVRHTSASGKQYLLTPTEEKNDWQPAVRSVEPGDEDMFIGKGRELVKTSPANGPLEVYKSLFPLIESLPSDEAMLARAPRIENKRDAPRVSEEAGQVTVMAWLFAVARERDNSYRLLLGNYPERSGASFLSAVVSGVPAGGVNEPLLRQARQKFKAWFGKQLPETETYWVIQPAVPVLVTASLHYSIDHPPSAIGMKGLRPGTNWELRPVTDIAFEPDLKPAE